MKCASCLEIKRSHPELTDKQLFPQGRVHEATTIFNGTAYCSNCLPKGSQHDQ